MIDCAYSFVDSSFLPHMLSGTMVVVLLGGSSAQLVLEQKQLKKSKTDSVYEFHSDLASGTHVLILHCCVCSAGKVGPALAGSTDISSRGGAAV